MENFSEPKDFLKVLDGAHHKDLGQNSEKKLDDDLHTSGRDMETSPKDSIDRHRQPDIDRPRPPDIDRHPSDDIDRLPLLHELPGYTLEEEPVEERIHESETSHLTFHEHLRPHICAKEAEKFHKRVKRIHDSVKIMVPCTMVEVEFSIRPIRSVHLGFYNGLFADDMYALASQRELRCKGEVDKDPAKASSIHTNQIQSIDIGRISEQKKFEVCQNLFDGGTITRSDKSGGKKRKNWKTRKRIKGDPRLSLIPHFSDGIRKYRVRYQMLLTAITKLRALLIAEMIDKGEEYMEEAFTKE